VFPRSRPVCLVLAGYAAALVAVIAATALRLALNPLLGSRMVFFIYYGVALAVAWFSGLKPAIAALGLGLLAGTYFLEAPLREAVGAEIWKIVYYLAGGVASVLLLAKLRSAKERAESAAAQAKEKTARILERMSDGFVSLDHEWRFLFVNPSAAGIFGIPREELLGKVAWEVFPCAIGGRICAELHRVAAEGTPGSCEEFYPPDRWLEADIYPCPLGTAVFFRDISDRKKADEFSARLAAIVNSSDDAIIGKTLNAEIVSWNPGAEKMYGYTASEVIGRPVSILFPEDRRPELSEMMERVKKGEHVRCVETVGRRKDGKPIDVSLTISPIKNAAGELAGLSSIARDISERKQAERERERSRALLEAVLQQMPAGVIIATPPSGELVLGNQHLEKMWRRPFQPAAGIQEYDRYTGLHPDGRPYLPEEWPIARSILAGEVVENEEIEFLRSDGTRRTIAASSTPVRAPDGTLIAAVGSFFDITERKRIYEEIKTALKEKELLLREVHHRVKNNLQIMSSLLSLQARSVPDERVRQICVDLQCRVRAMALVYGTLYQSGDLAHINFSQYLRRLTSEMLRSYGEDTNRIRIELEAEQVELNLETAIPCGLLVSELVSNALKHAFPAGRSGRIRIEAHRNADRTYTLTVSDNGVGLPKDFDFRNTHSMGMELVQSLSEQLGGVVHVHSGDGTTFRVTFAGQDYLKRL
jgi:PAS domain S-box-containing protein